MSFRLEAELVEPLTAWLEESGFDVWAEVPILGRRADLVGTRAGSVMAIELKMHDWAQALRQALAYQLAADQVWVAMPLAQAGRAYRQRWRFEAERVGLLAVDDSSAVRTPIRAGPSPRLLPFARDRILEAASVGGRILTPLARGGEGLDTSGPPVARTHGLEPSLAPGNRPKSSCLAGPI